MAGWRFRAGQRDQLGLLFTIKDRFNRRRLALLAGEHRVEALGHKLLTYPGHHPYVGVERATDFFVRPPLAGFALVGLEQDAGLENDLCRGFTLADQLIQPFALFAAEPDDESLVGHVAPPCRIFATGQESVFAAVRNNIFQVVQTTRAVGGTELQSDHLTSFRSRVT